jgi:hypothetical protein
VEEVNIVVDVADELTGLLLNCFIAIAAQVGGGSEL